MNLQDFRPLVLVAAALLLVAGVVLIALGEREYGGLLIVAGIALLVPSRVSAPPPDE